MRMPCDCVLIAGDVMVNESLLTGESCPVRKSPVQKENGDFSKENQVYEGTTVIKVKPF